MYRIESLLSARLFMSPQTVGDKLYFLSNLSGHLSLFAMDYGGSVPEPLLPPQIALQNPILMNGHSFYTFPKINKILVMIDNDGDENYQPMIIPLDGGFPEQIFGEALENYRVHCKLCDPKQNIIYLRADSLTEQKNMAYQGNLETGELVKLCESRWGANVEAYKSDHTVAILKDEYTAGDNVIYLWNKGMEGLQLLFGVPIEERNDRAQVHLNAIGSSHFTENNGLLFFTALYEDNYGLGYLLLNHPNEIKQISISNIVHDKNGEFEGLKNIHGNRYALKYNIDGCTWIYEGVFDEKALNVNLDKVLCGQGELKDGMTKDFYYDNNTNRYSLSFSSAKSPTQLLTIEHRQFAIIKQHTNERILGIPEEYLSTGEDASFISFDGKHIPARLYLPSPKLNISGPRPLAYYIHGGPHSQERPNFAWFSMPLIQYLTLNGIAVFVPNVRGSSGYGLGYMKLVDRDWGGDDRLDHVHAMEQFLPQDDRIDTTRAGLVGRSYGGYMTLILASRHPDLWSAAVDMFGPYNLITFLERIPETWKPYYSLVLGKPDDNQDLEFLIDRSPSTFIDRIECPLLVIQGRNDPRVVASESLDMVEHLRSIGKDVEYLEFENEGHDVLKLTNRVTCYNRINSFFVKHLRP
jgi:pimeloyl-ACP methyl ester carboxylesterase